MSYNAFVEDLRADALWRAGEPNDPVNGPLGNFYGKALEYLNKIQQVLMLGGGVAVGRDLATSAGIYAHLVGPPITDWWWARKQPRGVLVTKGAINTGTATATRGSTALTFSQAPIDPDSGLAISVAGYRIQLNFLPTVPKILSHTAGSTTAVLDAPWPEIFNSTNGFFWLFQLEYDLAPDFLRFCGTPYLHSNYMQEVQISVPAHLDLDFPLSVARREIPVAAAMISPQRIRFSSYDIRGYRFEYDYVMQPPDLTTGGTVLLPPHHRQVLSVGAAMCIAFDKGDTKATNLASEYRELVNVMLQEHRHMMAQGSNTVGQFKTRPGRQWRTRRGPQSNGGVFLI